MQRQVAHLPLHNGKAPRWLFDRMAKLAGAVTMVIVDEYGSREMLRRLADPWWFQAFGCALGFDWHSSGLTTVTGGAMKEARKLFGKELGIFVAGGKGGTSRKTPQEISDQAAKSAISGADGLVYASRMSAKVDSAAVQDGYQLYHHNFFFSGDGGWCVVQQGMNAENRWARRYHWLGESVTDFVCEPHAGLHDSSAVIRDEKDGNILNMVAQEAGQNRSGCAEIIEQNPDTILRELSRINQTPDLLAPAGHWVTPANVNLPRIAKIIRQAHEAHPEDFKTLLGLQGVGPATVRSLSLLAELMFDAPASRRDPATPLPTRKAEGRSWADYSYAHGGKDGTPFPVDRKTYDRNIQILTEAVRKARAGDRDKADALKRLARFEHKKEGSPIP